MADDEYARFETMTNVELRAELKRRNCPTSGNKKDLLAKLRAALQKQYEQQIPQSTLNHSVGYTQNETPVIYTNLPIHDQVNLSIPQNVDPVIEQEQIPLKPRTRSKKPSIDSQTNEIPQANKEQIVVDNSNNVERNSFVSKSNEEEQKNIENIGEDINLPSIGNSSSSAKLESIVKEIPSSDEQQQPEINATIDAKDEPSKSVDLQPQTTKENEVVVTKEPEKSQHKPNRVQISSLAKISNRSTLNKINLTSELLQTLISDLSLVPESMITDELDSEDNNESILETSIANDYLSSDSMTIGELADQKQQTNRTVAIDDPSTRKKINSLPARLSSFESKTFVDGKTNNIVTDEPVRIKDVTTTNEPASEILYIRGLTRPFSLMQLKGLLSRYGTLVDGEFWLDKIKSQCFVTYHTLDEAQNAREALDGCRWPSTNPKTLSVRYARQEEFEFSKIHDAPPNHLSADSTDRVVEELTSPVDEIESKNNSEELKQQKQSGFLITDEEAEDEEEAVKTNEQSMKGLDDYFRKTKAKPSIYWLPLTDEQIIERARRQEQRNAERDEEQRKRETDDNARKLDKRKHSSSPARRDAKRH